MADTVESVIATAARKIGVIPDNQAAPANVMQRGLEILNDIIDEWSGNRINIPYQSLITLPLVANQLSYTIGPSASYDLNSATVIEVLELIVNDSVSPGIDYPTIPLTEQMYFNIPYKSATGIPTTYLLRNFNDYAQIFFQPLPYASTLSASILVKQKLSRVELTQDLDEIPRHYLLALKYRIAVLLADIYGKTLPASMIAMANQSMDNMQAANAYVDFVVKRDEVLNRKNTVFFNWWL